MDISIGPIAINKPPKITLVMYFHTSMKRRTLHINFGHALLYKAIDSSKVYATGGKFTGYKEVVA